MYYVWEMIISSNLMLVLVCTIPCSPLRWFDHVSWDCHFATVVLTNVTSNKVHSVIKNTLLTLLHPYRWSSNLWMAEWIFMICNWGVSRKWQHKSILAKVGKQLARTLYEDPDQFLWPWNDYICCCKRSEVLWQLRSLCWSCGLRCDVGL
jgi:hypothetical protein